MNKKTLIIALVALVAITGPLFLLVGEAVAEPYEGDYRISGTSKTSSGSALILGIDEGARTAYPLITWTIYLKADTQVNLTTPNGVIVDSVLPAGLHDFTDHYEPDAGAIIATWTVGPVVKEYRLNIASSASSAVSYDRADDSIKVTPDFLNKEEREVALGSIICALVPSLFLIPYWQRKKDEDFYYAF